jgi:hypothetical protein
LGADFLSAGGGLSTAQMLGGTQTHDKCKNVEKDPGNNFYYQVSRDGTRNAAATGTLSLSISPQGSNQWL